VVIGDSSRQSHAMVRLQRAAVETNPDEPNFDADEFRRATCSKPSAKQLEGAGANEPKS